MRGGHPLVRAAGTSKRADHITDLRNVKGNERHWGGSRRVGFDRLVDQLERDRLGHL